MKSWKNLVLFAVATLLIQSTNCQPVEQQDDLLLVQILFRHGDRTPIQLYKLDHYTKEQFPEGFSQLTASGKDRLLQYGQLLRQRYSKYIEKTLIRNVRAQSSPSRHSLESAEFLLASLFLLNSTQFWSNHSELSHLWQPVAVETADKSRAWLLNSWTPCPAANHIEKVLSTEQLAVKQFVDDNQEFLKKLEKYTGEQYASSHWHNVAYLWDTLYTEQQYFGDKFVKPNWLDLVGNDTWERLYQFYELDVGEYDHSPQYQRFRAGPFLKEIIANFNATKTDATQENHVFTYSSHYTTISYIQQALGLWKGKSPTFGNGLIFELRRGSSSQIPEVHIFYANVTNNFEIAQLHLNESKTFAKRCTHTYCSLPDFEAALETFLPIDIEKECV